MQKSLTYHKYTASAYSEKPEGGHFAKCRKQGENGVKRSEEWEHCRETFDHYFPRGQYFLFYTDEKRSKTKNGEKVAQFIEAAEKRLNVTPKTEILGFNNVSNIIAVSISKWWKENGARRQLFTILLRAGLAYDGKNFEKALYKEEYASQTNEAVARFFKGYTHCTMSMCGGNGWVSNFCRDDADYEADWDDDSEDNDDKAWKKYLETTLRKP